MTKTLDSVATDSTFPESTAVVIIGGGIVGVSAALTLAERNVPVVLFEKGHIAGEQSSRNLGWVRKTSRHAEDIPMSQAADRLWSEMPERVGREVGYKQCGIMFVSPTDAGVSVYEQWLESVQGLSLDSRLVTADEIDQLVPGGTGKWAGGVYTPSDAVAEPSLATSAIAEAAVRAGAKLIQGCAVRTLEQSAGRVTGVVTERGEIKCEQVLLAGGAWSRRFLGNLKVGLPMLPLVLSVLRTKPFDGPTDIAVGGPDFSFRKHRDGGFIITQRGALEAPILLDHLLIGMRYKHQLAANRQAMRIKVGKAFLEDLKLPRRWGADSQSPFEQVRVMDPAVNEGLNAEAMANLCNAWPVFTGAEIDEAWAGWIDITPDSLPVVDRVESIPGLTVATGFSGHGFGTGPAAGQLAADLVTSSTPLVDASPYRLDRF
ncbi:MAG: FAD-binding oxidoreductase [Pseudomonadota bacterium]